MKRKVIKVIIPGKTSSFARTPENKYGFFIEWCRKKREFIMSTAWEYFDFDINAVNIQDVSK